MYKIPKYIEQMINTIGRYTVHVEQSLHTKYLLYNIIPSYGLGTSIKILDKVIEKIIIIFILTKKHI